MGNSLSLIVAGDESPEIKKGNLLVNLYGQLRKCINTKCVKEFKNLLPIDDDEDDLEEIEFGRVTLRIKKLKSIKTKKIQFHIVSPKNPTNSFCVHKKFFTSKKNLKIELVEREK